MLRIWDAIIRAMDVASSVCVAGIVIVVGGQVVLRYVFASPPVWGEDMARWLFAWNIFLGAAVLVRYEAHLTVGILIDRLSPCVNRWRKLFVDVLLLVTMAVLFWQTVQLMCTFGLTPAAATQVPMGLYFGSGMVFATVAVVEYVRQTFQSIRDLYRGTDEGSMLASEGAQLRVTVKL